MSHHGSGSLGGALPPGHNGLRRNGLHGYKTFVLALVVSAGYFAGYAFEQAAAVIAGVPGFVVALAALVGANEAANVLRQHTGRVGAVVHAETAEVTGEPVEVRATPHASRMAAPPQSAASGAASDPHASGYNPFLGY